jgi:shikimate 5-dehydrogenase
MISFLPLQAKAIGAVNTIVKDPSTGKLLGDNTDWIGIRDAVRAKLQRVARKQKNGSNRSGGNASPAAKIVSSPLSPANIKMNVTMGPGTSPNRGNGPAYLPSVFGGTAARESTFVPAAGLVVGAGGTARAACFALVKMGCRDIRIFNRTKSKAVALAKEFPNTRAVEELTSAGGMRGVEIVLCTVPAAAQFVLPAGAWAVDSNPPKVVLDAAYRPRETRLLEQARISGGAGVARVEGIDMLIMQGYGQLRRWTGKRELTPAVRAAVSRSVRQYYAESA